VNYATAIANELHKERRVFDAYLIVSSMDLELMRATAKKSKVCIEKELRKIPSLKSFSEAFDRGGIESLHSLAVESATAPQSVWWCETRETFEREINGIYERLAKSRRPFDAYDYGVIGSIAWILLWIDR
jgi:hypothetical protein